MNNVDAAPMQGERMLSVRETAKILGWCLDSVRRHLRSGDMPGVRLGRNWKIPESQLAVYMGFTEERMSAPPFPSHTVAPVMKPQLEQLESESEIVLQLLNTATVRAQVRNLLWTAMKHTDATYDVTQQALKELDRLLKAK